MIIGVTGTDGGGKGTVVEYLVSQKGFVHCSARALWLEEMERQGLETSRANMRLTANALRAKHGDDYLIVEYLRRAQMAGWKDIIIDSLRALAEVTKLKSEGGVLIAIDADPHVRYERMQKRAAEKPVSFEEFMAHEALEMNDTDPHGMQKAKVMQAADYTLVNDGTLAELHAQINSILEKLRK